MKKITLFLLILPIHQILRSQVGLPDPGFGNNGVIKTYPAVQGVNATTFAKECLLQADGKLIMVLQIDVKTKLNRRLANGNTDASYGTNGYSAAVSMIVTAGAMQPDGKIVVAGTTDGFSDFMLARYNANGTLDSSFGNSGVVITDLGSRIEFLNAVVVTPGGEIIAGGSSAVSGNDQFTLVQYNSSGMIDNGFGTNGIVLTNFTNADASSVGALALQPDAKIIAVGRAFTNGNGDFAIARYNANGSPDPGFNGTGQATTNFSFNDGASSVVVNSSDKIIVGGQSVDASGNAHFTIARYNTNGSPDNSFNGGTGFITTVFSTGIEFLINIRLQADGKIIAAGHTVSDPAGNDIVMLRINSNGTIDNSFGTGGNGQVRAGINAGDDESDFLLVQPDGRIVTGGSNIDFTNGFEVRFIGFRFNANGTPDAGFGTSGSFAELLNSAFFQYTAVFQQPDGHLLAVSEMADQTNYRVFLNRFNAGGTPDNSFGQNGVYALNDFPGLSIFQPDGKLLRLSGDNGNILLFRNNADGTADAGFGNGGEVITDLGELESPIAAAFQSDGKIIIGGLLRDANGSDFLVVRYNANGSIDASFGTNGFTRVDFSDEENVLAIAVAPDGKIVFGGTSFSFFPVFRTYTLLGRLNANGSIDLAFGDQGKKVIDRSPTENFGNLAIQNDNKILFTSFETDNSSTLQTYLGRLNTDGSTDNSFGQNGIVPCDGSIVILQADQKILVPGSRKNNRNNTDFVLTRFTTGGQVDLSFGTNGQTTRNFAGLDNNFFAAHFAGNNLFVAGAGVDQEASILAMIAKFIVGCQPPVINGLSVSPTTLWPPNHKLKDVTVNYTVSSNCGVINTEVLISSNEPVSPGEQDWEIINNHFIRLRAESDGNGNGRIYTIKVIVTDISGNKDTAIATVTVPKSQGYREYEPLLISVSPNPSPDHFYVTINSKSTEKMKIRLLNYSGKVLRTIENVRAQQTIKIGDELRSGIYFIEVIQAGSTETKKLIKL